MALHDLLDSNNELINTPVLSPEIVLYYNKQLTKTGLLVLRTLERHGTLQQKALSDFIGTSPNSLSNLLSKMDLIRPKLLNATYIGRYKEYSLTDEAKAYLQILDRPNDNTNIRAFTDINSTEYIYRQAKECLQNIQGLSLDWENRFHNYLTKTSSKSEDAFSSACKEFMDQMVSLTAKGQASALNDIYNFVQNTILISEIKDKIAETVGQNQYMLLTLYQLEKADPPSAMALINKIISEMCPSAMKGIPLMPENHMPEKITEAQYCTLFYAISLMRNQYLDCDAKAEVIKCWSTPYHPESWIPQYLATVFELISQAQR